MLSLDLFNSRYEKKLHEGAVDTIIARLIEPLSRRAADIRTQIRSGKLSSTEISKLEKEYEDLVQKKIRYYFRSQNPNPRTTSAQPARSICLCETRSKRHWRHTGS
jgi:hypothetical protein